LQRRTVILAITTLTLRLRRYPAEPSFLLHWRNPAAVATAGGVYDVIPAGEFQPSSVALWDRRSDFDMWRNITGEYSEELLGTPEHDGTRTEPIDYESWPLYQALEQAQAAGTVTVFLLGVGLDALTLAATILTAVVIEDDVFDAAFGHAVRFNDEGKSSESGMGARSKASRLRLSPLPGCLNMSRCSTRRGMPCPPVAASRGPAVLMEGPRCLLAARLLPASASGCMSGLTFRSTATT
jgi:hypothetical protein